MINYTFLQTNKLRNSAWSFANLFFKLVVFLVFCFFLQSCKEPNGIGSEVQPESEKFNLNSGTNSNFISYSIKESVIRTDETSLNLLGSYNDPIFGKASAGFISQFVLTQNTPDFGDSAKVDSVVLSLPYSGYYGSYSGANDKQRVLVYELNNNILYKDSVYYSNFSTTGNIVDVPIADTLVQFDPIKSLVVDGTNVAAQLRIKLNKSFGEGLLNPSNAPFLNSSGEFLNYLGGLYITTNNQNQAINSGAIYYFNLLNTESKVTLYFHNTTSSGTFVLNVISDCTRINVLSTDHTTTSEITAQLNDKTSGQENFYLQSLGGLKAKIELPVLAALKDSMPLAINKAEITLKVKSGTFSEYAPPARLFITRIDSTGTAQFVADQADGDTYYGGYYNASTNDYTFNLARYFQQVVSGKIKDYGLYLLVGGSAVSANRVVLEGGNKINLKLTYTKL